MQPNHSRITAVAYSSLQRGEEATVERKCLRTRTFVEMADVVDQRTSAARARVDRADRLIREESREIGLETHKSNRVDRFGECENENADDFSLGTCLLCVEVCVVFVMVYRFYDHASLYNVTYD